MPPDAKKSVVPEIVISELPGRIYNVDDESDDTIYYKWSNRAMYIV